MPKPLEIAEAHVVDVVEAAYANVSSEEWFESVARAFGRAIPCVTSVGAASYEWRYDERGDFRMVDFSMLITGDDMRWSESARAGIRMLPPSLAERVHGRMHAGTLTRQSGMGKAVLDHPVLEEALDRRLKDQLGIVVPEPDGRAFLFVGALFEETRIPKHTQRVLDRMTFHLAAGHRVRRRAIDEADAVFSTSGKLLHADGTAKERRDVLAEGFRRRAHARKDAANADAALDVWRALTAGRWSIVDHWDSDGKRFAIAIRNPPRVLPFATLSPRERRVAALVAAGHRDKEIAYILGLTLPTIVTTVARARKKLGVTTRTDLAVAWRTRNAASDDA